MAARLADGVYNVNTDLAGQLDTLTIALECNPQFNLRAPLEGAATLTPARLNRALYGNSVRAGARKPGGGNTFASSYSGGLPSGFRLFGSNRLERAVPETFMPKKSNFGYVAMGTSKAWKGHMIIVTRGTMGENKFSPDWLSNYNIGVRPGPGGAPVHAGFHTVWSGFRSFINDAIATFSPTAIHCVGHSLGGALASLNAQMLARSGKNVALYTFGAPRVGTLPFIYETASLGIQTKRVYHPADPVPMIPMMPFLHAPISGGIRLNAPAGLLVDFGAHDMAKSYRSKVKGRTWGDLEAVGPIMSDFQVDSWLQQAATRRGGYTMRSAALLERIAIGLARLIKKAGIYVLGSGISARISATLTTLDFVAWLLARAAEMAKVIADELLGLVNAIFGFLGRVGNMVESLTQRALRWVLDLLFSFLASVAHNAIDRLR